MIFSDHLYSKAMADAGTVAVLLPASTYFIKEQARPPVALFREHRVPIALATNCNPGKKCPPDV